MSKYYFLETVLVKGNLKVKALPGQKLKDGSNVSTSLYVQCPKKIRDVYSEGTIFISTSLNLSSSGGKFYTQKGFQRLTYKDEEAKKEYKTLTGIDFVDPLKKDTILETILKDASLISPSSTKDQLSKDYVIEYLRKDPNVGNERVDKYFEVLRCRETGIYCEDDIVNHEVSEFLKVYIGLKTIYDKLKMLCEYGLSEVEIDIVLGQLNDSDEVKSYYTILKPEKLKNLYYNSTNIKKYLGIVTFSPELLVNTIHQNFNPGEKYSLSNLKVKLGDLYSSISYTAVPKANDILNYFEVKEYMTTEVVDGKKKRVRGYELLKRKDN